MTEPSSFLRTTYVFNKTLPEVISSNSFHFNSWQIANLPFLKYVPYDKALCLLPDYLIHFLKHFPVVKGYKYCLLDVMPQMLEAGDTPCVPRWRMEITDNPLGPGGDEQHFLYTCGLRASTFFLADPLSIEILDANSDLSASINKQVLLQQPLIVEAEDATIYRLTRNHLRYCGVAQKTGWRLLVQKSYTNLLRKGTIHVRNSRRRV